MSSDEPRPGAVPGWGQPTDPSPTEPVPAAPPPAGQPSAPEPAAPAVPAPGSGWGQQPAAAPAPAAPAAPATPSSGWGEQAQTPPPASPPASPPPGGGQWGAAPPPGAVPPGAVPPGQPGAGAPANWNPQPKPPGNNGCLKACLIIGVLLVILFFVAIAGLAFIGNRIFESVGVDAQGNLQPCPFVSNQELSQVLGPGTEAIPLQGFFDATLGLILDKRVMPDDEDCWITSDGTNGTGRIAFYRGPDAAAKFQQEKQNAQPTSQDQGGGVTLENPGYFGGDVSGVGDEAFCTGISPAIMAGVLVRQGDQLVYVSLLGAMDAGPGFGGTSSGVVTSDETCQQAIEVARVILQ